MREQSKRLPPEPKVSWISVNFGILLLLLLMALVGWAAWYLPRDYSTSVSYELIDPPRAKNSDSEGRERNP